MNLETVAQRTKKTCYVTFVIETSMDDLLPRRAK
jgi:hypothetical protein